MKVATIDQSRLEYLQGIGLSKGVHEPEDDRYCLLEACAWVAGEPLTDYPRCVSPGIANFLREWNDVLRREERNLLLLPLIPKLIGTRDTIRVARERELLASKWLVNSFASTWVRAAGCAELAALFETAIDPPMELHLPAKFTPLKMAAACETTGEVRMVLIDQVDNRPSLKNFEAARLLGRAGLSAFNVYGCSQLERSIADRWLPPARSWGAAANTAAYRIAKDAASLIVEGGGAPEPIVQQLQASAVDLVHRMIAVGGRRA